MATTAGGLPYPADTDGFANGDLAIKALAEALDPVRFKGTINANTALAVGFISFTAVEDSHGGWATNQLFVARAGLYRLHARLKWTGTVPTATVALRFMKNGATAISSQNYANSPAFGGCSFQGEIRCNANDTLALYLAAGPFTTQYDAPESCSFSIQRIAP